MKLSLVWIGKTVAGYLQTGIEEYVRRVSFYQNLELIEIPALKNTKSLTMAQQRDRESELLLKTFAAGDYVVLLDDKGRQHTSMEFAAWLDGCNRLSYKRLVFVIGGAYGFSQAVYDRANGLLSLSKMTYSHQMVRLLFLEQLYRAHTILSGEPYHHEESLLKR